MAKQRILGTSGRDRIDLTGAERTIDPRFDGFEVFAGADIDTVTGSALDDVLLGEGGDDTLDGGAGHDLLVGGKGNDTLIGGAGSDTAVYSDRSSYVDVNLATGIATVGVALLPGAPLERDTLSGIENATAGDGGSRMTGNNFANVLTGGRGDDMLDGGAGNDTLIGGDGVDTVSYAGRTPFLDVDLAAGFGRLISPSNLVLEQDALSGIENAIAGNGGSRLRGDGADNRLTGGTGMDTLEGRDGDDTLKGGLNSDALDGGEGNDTLFGGDGNDTIFGGNGIDTVSFAGEAGFLTVLEEINSGGVVHTARLTVNGIQTGRDTLFGIENVTAGDGGSLIRGTSAQNVLIGGAGNDEMSGGGGNDTMVGGDGVDTVSFAGFLGFVSIQPVSYYQDMSATALSFLHGLLFSLDSLHGFENFVAGERGSLIYANRADNGLTGGQGVDELHGQDGNDTLDGGLGNDILDGGDHIDTVSYAGRTEQIRVRLGVAEPHAEVFGTEPSSQIIETDRLIGIENVVLGDGGGLALGDHRDNRLEGGAGRDTLNGGGGNDTLLGGDEEDRLFGSVGEDILEGGKGCDDLFGGANDDVLTGGGGRDTFYTSVGGFDDHGTDTVTDFDTTALTHDSLSIDYFLFETGLAQGTDAAEAIASGHLVLTEYGTPGEAGFGTAVSMDRNGGAHAPQDMTEIFRLDGVSAASVESDWIFLN